MGQGGNGLVRLNVGGVWYTTTLSTLQTFPDSIFPKMLAQRDNKKRGSKEDESKGYYFIDRDGDLFRYILNFMRTEELSLPANFQDMNQLIKEAEFYGLRCLANILKAKLLKQKRISIIEVVETAHPDKIGVCTARVVLQDSMRNHSIFKEIIENMPKYYNEEYRGQFGRFWIRTNITRIDWAERLTREGWTYLGTNTVSRRIIDIKGQNTDICHVIEKWSINENQLWQDSNKS